MTSVFCRNSSITHEHKIFPPPSSPCMCPLILQHSCCVLLLRLYFSMDSTLEHKLVASWCAYTELRRLQCVSKTWNNVETPYDVLEHCIWVIAAGYGRRFRSCVWEHVAECHEDTGADLQCQCRLCREFLRVDRDRPLPWCHGQISVNACIEVKDDTL